jgi:hypothetical protein
MKQMNARRLAPRVRFVDNAFFDGADDAVMLQHVKLMRRAIWQYVTVSHFYSIDRRCFENAGRMMGYVFLGGDCACRAAVRLSGQSSVFSFVLRCYRALIQ